MYKKHWNISSLLNKLMEINPYYEFVLTNILTSKIEGKKLTLIFPDIQQLKTNFFNHKDGLAKDLLELTGYKLECDFISYKEPFLPHPASASKHHNYLLFLFMEDKASFVVIIKKPHFIYAFENFEKPPIKKVIKNNVKWSPYYEFTLLKGLFLDIIDCLKEEWSYLHPLFPFFNYEDLFFHKLLIENLFVNIEKEENVKDVRRFIGRPIFTPLNYKNRIERWL